MRIAHVLAKRGDIISVSPGEPVSKVVALLTDHRIGAVPVVDDNNGVVGIMSERDIIYRLNSDGPAMLEWPVEKVMTAAVVTVPSDTGLLGGLALMTQRRIRHLPVVDEGRMVGFISIGDLVKARMDGIEAEANAMREYIQSV
jgi:Predicted signal-transduction protein containing cAMP-binding and CBS domains